MNSDISQEYLEVDFSDIKPIQVKAGEIANIITAIESMVESQIYQRNPGLKKEPLILSFTDIRSDSIDLQFHSPYFKDTIAVFQKVGQAINDNNYSGLPEITYKAIDTIAGFTRKHHSRVEFIHQNSKRNVIATIPPDTVLSRPPALIGETTIYAKVIRVGGQKPKVEVETVNGDTLFCEASIDITTKLGTRLYQIVGLVGTAIWDSELNNIEQFSIKDVTEYANTSIKEAMNELSRLTKEYYSNIDDVEEYISEIRGSN